jgi:hypothetical protein
MLDLSDFIIHGKINNQLTMLQFIEDILTEFREQPELLTKTVPLYFGGDIIILCNAQRCSGIKGEIKKNEQSTIRPGVGRSFQKRRYT